jgi:hypothetical protein
LGAIGAFVTSAVGAWAKLSSTVRTAIGVVALVGAAAGAWQLYIGHVRVDAASAAIAKAREATLLAQVAQLAADTARLGDSIHTLAKARAAATVAYDSSADTTTKLINVVKQAAKLNPATISTQLAVNLATSCQQLVTRAELVLSVDSAEIKGLVSDGAKKDTLLATKDTLLADANKKIKALSPKVSPVLQKVLIGSVIVAAFLAGTKVAIH